MKSFIQLLLITAVFAILTQLISTSSKKYTNKLQSIVEQAHDLNECTKLRHTRVCKYKGDRR